MQDRLDRLEKDLSMLQRQVYRSGPAPVVSAGSGGAVDTELRMDRLETQMRELTGRDTAPTRRGYHVAVSYCPTAGARLRRCLDAPIGVPIDWNIRGTRMGFGGFSWKRAIGLSAAKARLSRRIGIPLTKSGRQRKLGSLVGRYETVGDARVKGLYIAVEFVKDKTTKQRAVETARAQVDRRMGLLQGLGIGLDLGKAHVLAGKARLRLGP